MSIYARIERGVVQEIIDPVLDEDGKEIPISARYHPMFVAGLVDITGATPVPEQNWVATESSGSWVFSAPPIPLAVSE